MKQNAKHIRLKVVMGYILLIAIAVCSVAYIYSVIQQLAGEDEPDSIPRQKVYLVTGTLSLLYESEALSQLVGMEEKDLGRFNRTLTRAQQNIDSLRLLVSDSVQLLKIDTINDLLERKRWNTRQLLATLKEANTEDLYRQNIEKVLALQDTLREQVKIEERVVEKTDTMMLNKPRKGFFKRLAEAFNPSENIDTGYVVNSTRQIVTDTLVQPFNASDTIMTVLRSIQDSVADQRRELEILLAAKANNLRYNNSILTRRINQMLRDIEQEEIDASMNRVHERQTLLRETSRLIGFIAICASLVAVVFLVFILRDLSRSQYYRSQLEKAKKYAEDLLHSREKLMLTISHDIRAPLSSIIGYIELLENLGAGGRERYYLENMTGSANHILALVNDLLDFHRLESNRMEIHPVPFGVSMLFNEIYTSFRPIAENKGLDFVFDLSEEYTSLQYTGDPIRIRQVAGNLISNALKFTSEGRVELHVWIPEKGEHSALLAFAVKDAGPGIPVSEQEKIFGEFSRLGSTEGIEGFGLGLSITRKLVALMGGTLTLESVPGAGSTFRVVLPLGVSDVREVEASRVRETSASDTQKMSASDMQAEPSSEGKRGAASGVRGVPGSQGGAVSGMQGVSGVQDVSSGISSTAQDLSACEVHCLLVDDDPLQLAMTGEMLARGRIRVTSCTDPHEVLRLLEQQAFDVVITDIQMPVMDGFSLLREIRASSVPHVAALPVIALSAESGREDEHYISAGFTAFLNKPFTGKQLLNLVGTLVSRKFGELSCEGGEAEGLDFSALTVFAGDDPEASAHILSTFCRETMKNLDLLREAHRENNRGLAAKTAHKLLPLISMLKESETAVFLGRLEKESAVLSPAEWEDLLGRVEVRILSVVERVQRKDVE